jgi:hypothetical protein
MTWGLLTQFQTDGLAWTISSGLLSTRLLVLVCIVLASASKHTIHWYIWDFDRFSGPHKEFDSMLTYIKSDDYKHSTLL